jgi:hypothetical protein
MCAKLATPFALIKLKIKFKNQVSPWRKKNVVNDSSLIVFKK